MTAALRNAILIVYDIYETRDLVCSFIHNSIHHCDFFVHDELGIRFYCSLNVFRIEGSHWIWSARVRVSFSLLSTSSREMSEYWVSKKKYYCKYCEIYIADDAPSRQQHENGLRHKGNRDRFIRGLYKDGEKKKKDLEEEKREMARVEMVCLYSSNLYLFWLVRSFIGCSSCVFPRRWCW